MKKIFYTIAIVSLLLSCNTDRGFEDSTNALINIKIEPSNFVDSLNLSKIVEDFSIIKLETIEDCLIGNITKVVCFSSWIYVFDFYNQTLFKFDAEGKFITKIGKRGRGPGEFLELSDFTVDSLQNCLLLLDYKKIHKFDLNGKFIESNACSFISSHFSIIPKNGFAFYGAAKEHRIIKADNSFKIISKHIPYSLKNRIQPLYPITHFKDKILFDIPLCDTIFQLVEDKITPYIHIDFGDSKFSNNDYNELSNNQKENVFDYLGQTNFSREYLFLPTDDHFYFAVVFNGTPYAGFFDIETKNIVFSPIKMVKNDLFWTDFSLYPLGVIDNKYIFSVKASSIVDSKESRDWESKKLNNIFDDINEYSNPVLVFVQIGKI